MTEVFQNNSPFPSIKTDILLTKLEMFLGKKVSGGKYFGLQIVKIFIFTPEILNTHI